VSEPVLTPLVLSLKVALAATAAVLPPGILLGFVLSRKSFFGKALVETVVHLPLVVPPTAVGFLLPGAIAAFRRQHPGVVFQVKEAGSREIETAVGSEELELGIVTLPTRTRELDERPLARDRIVLVASKDHPLARRQRVDARALNGQNLVGFEAGSAVRWLIDGALREAQVEMNVVMELRSVAAILQMVETTGSLAFVSELSVQSEQFQRSGAVVPLLVRGLEIQRELALISKRGRSLSPAARAFSDSLG